MKNLKVKQKGKYELEKPFWLTKIKLVKNAFNIHALTFKVFHSKSISIQTITQSPV